MEDIESNSLWVHLTGTCMQGAHKGKILDVYPSVITDWQTWKQTHPDTDASIIKPRTITRYESDWYETDGRQYSVAFRSGGESKAWRYEYLADEPLLNDELGGTKLVIWFEKNSSAAWGYDREVDERVLEFELKDGQIIDTQTESTWDLRKGLAVDGPMKDTRLKALPTLITLSRAWDAFHGDSKWWPHKDGIISYEFER